MDGTNIGWERVGNVRRRTAVSIVECCKHSECILPSVSLKRMVLFLMMRAMGDGAGMVSITSISHQGEAIGGRMQSDNKYITRVSEERGMKVSESRVSLDPSKFKGGGGGVVTNRDGIERVNLKKETSVQLLLLPEVVPFFIFLFLPPISLLPALNNSNNNKHLSHSSVRSFIRSFIFL